MARWIYLILAVVMLFVSHIFGQTSQPSSQPSEGKASVVVGGVTYSYQYRLYSPKEDIPSSLEAPDKIASSKDAFLKMYAYMYKGNVKEWRKLWNDAP